MRAWTITLLLFPLMFSNACPGAHFYRVKLDLCALAEPLTYDPSLVVVSGEFICEDLLFSSSFESANNGINKISAWKNNKRQHQNSKKWQCGKQYKQNDDSQCLKHRDVIHE